MKSHSKIYSSPGYRITLVRGKGSLRNILRPESSSMRRSFEKFLMQGSKGHALFSEVFVIFHFRVSVVRGRALMSNS